MMYQKTVTYFLVLYIRLVVGQMDKISLTFVIDDTGSMQGDIDQVKEGVNLIFDSVTKSKDSPIADFIIVTFNDKPTDVSLLARTTDRNEFRASLSQIKAHGGGNCPESCLSGIKRGLEESRFGSLLYVFTDDVAEDVWLFDEVQNLAISKNIQVVFILTRNRYCGRKDKPEYQYYYKLAQVTSGEVFRMDKAGVTQILNYVSEKIKNTQTEILSETLPAGYGHKISIPVDPAMTDTMITCIGTKPEIKDLIGPDGSKADSATVVDLPGVTSVKLPNPVPGNYTAKVGSESETKVVAAATTKISFKYGFSPVEPTTMADTVTMPITDVESHICVQIFSEEAFTPSKIILSDDHDKQIKNLTLKLINAKEHINITDKTLPPGGLFKIGVFGYHEESKSNITRKSKTFIKVEVNTKPVKDMSPVMEIDKGLSIKVEYDHTITLVCKVEAYPKPDITWKDEDGNIFPTKVLTFKLPYSYMAELKLEKVTVTKTYKCSASNNNGEISRNIKVETERTQFLDILEEPKDTNIIYKNSDKIYCKVDALPTITITWKRDGAILKTDEFVEISDTGDMITVKQMLPHLVGGYSCVASNGLESKELEFKLSITGTEPTTLIAGPSKVNAEYNKPLFLQCQVEGYPKPKILWVNEKTGEILKSAPVAVPAPYDVGEEMQMEKVNKNATYKCIAKNENGEHSSVVTVVTIQKVHFNIIEAPKDTTIKYKEEGQLICKIDAYPAPIIQWKFKGKAINNNEHYEISPDGFILRVRDMQPSLKGFYSCLVDHVKTHTRKNLKFILSISGAENPQIDKTEYDINAKEGFPVDIDCRIIAGTPPPTITWEFLADNDVKFRELKDSSDNIHFERVTRYDSGEYKCNASNVVGYDEHVVYLTVQFPPTIEKAEKQIDARDGDKTKLQCVARGSPTPKVVWSINGKNISADGEYEIFRDNSLRFTASIKNNGEFICTAENEHGTAKIQTQVNYYKEIQFETPEATSVNTFVGEKEKLRCEANSYPEPTITWLFLSSEAKPDEKPKVLKTAKSPDELIVKIKSTYQDGVYICSASNKKSEKKLAFKIDVKEPAHIITDTSSSKPIKAVKGDLVRIPCKAVGKPKPSVTWMKNGDNIPTGYDPYSLDPSGDLLIEGITEGGVFYCAASNKLSAPAYMPFTVELEDFPRPTKIYATYRLEFGKPAEVKCPVPHTLVDLLRWYKNNALKVVGELRFDRVTHSDAGVYTCRVTHRITVKSESNSVEVAVIA